MLFSFLQIAFPTQDCFFKLNHLVTYNWVYTTHAFSCWVIFHCIDHNWSILLRGLLKITHSAASGVHEPACLQPQPDLAGREVRGSDHISPTCSATLTRLHSSRTSRTPFPQILTNIWVSQTFWFLTIQSMWCYLPVPSYFWLQMQLFFTLPRQIIFLCAACFPTNLHKLVEILDTNPEHQIDNLFPVCCLFLSLLSCHNIYVFGFDTNLLIFPFSRCFLYLTSPSLPWYSPLFSSKIVVFFKLNLLFWDLLETANKAGQAAGIRGLQFNSPAADTVECFRRSERLNMAGALMFRSLGEVRGLSLQCPEHETHQGCSLLGIITYTTHGLD